MKRLLFIKRAESLADWTWGGTADDEQSEEIQPQLSDKIPRIALQSRRTMKDVEIVSYLLLLLEEGPKGYSTEALDKAFSDRDPQWPAAVRIEDEYRRTITKIRDVIETVNGRDLIQSRFSNQTDFYSLFGAIAELSRENKLPNAEEMLQRLLEFAQRVSKCSQTPSAADPKDPVAEEYYQAARSASNDAGPRQTRIRIVKNTLLGLGE